MPSDRRHQDELVKRFKYHNKMSPDELQEVIHYLMHSYAFDPQRCEFCAADYGNRQPGGAFITLVVNQITSVNDAVLFIQTMEDMFQHPQDIHITNLNISKEVIK